MARGPASHLKVPENRVVFNPRKQHPHGVGSIVQEGNPSSIQVTGQLMDVRLQLGKCWHRRSPRDCCRAGPTSYPDSDSSEPSPHPDPWGTRARGCGCAGIRRGDVLSNWGGRRGVGAQGSTRKLVGAKSLPKHGGERIWAAAQARSASPSEDEGLWFASCVRGSGDRGRTGRAGRGSCDEGSVSDSVFYNGFPSAQFLLKAQFWATQLTGALKPPHGARERLCHTNTFPLYKFTGWVFVLSSPR